MASLTSVGGNSTEEQLFEINSNGTVQWDVDSYVLKLLGPNPFTMEVTVLMTLIYAVIFLTGLVGNVITCVVIVRNPSMHTATNCYLFSMAVSDFVFILFGI